MLAAARAVGVVFGPAFEDEIGFERNRPEIVDGHVARHGDDIAMAVGLAHGFIEHRSDDAAVCVAGRSLELRGEAHTAEARDASSSTKNCRWSPASLSSPQPKQPFCVPCASGISREVAALFMLFHSAFSNGRDDLPLRYTRIQIWR